MGHYNSTSLLGLRTYYFAPVNEKRDASLVVEHMLRLSTAFGLDPCVPSDLRVRRARTAMGVKSLPYTLQSPLIEPTEMNSFGLRPQGGEQKNVSSS